MRTTVREVNEVVGIKRKKIVTTFRTIRGLCLPSGKGVRRIPNWATGVSTLALEKKLTD